MKSVICTDFNESFIFGPVTDFVSRARVLQEMLVTLTHVSQVGSYGAGSPIVDETAVSVTKRVGALVKKYHAERFDPLDGARVR